MTRSMAVALACAAAGCATPRYLAKVNDHEVDGQELKDEFVRRHGGHQRFLTADVYIVRKFLDSTVDRRLLLEEAYRLGIQDAPDIQQDCADLLLRKEVELLVKVEVQDKAVPADEEVRAAYESKTEDLYLVREIVLATRVDAEAARAGLEGGADFEAIARERSIADSRKYGGLLPEVAWGSRSPEWEAAVFALEPKQLTSVLDVGAGYAIVRLESKRKAEKPDYAKAAPRIQAILQHRKYSVIHGEFLDSLWKKYGAATSALDHGAERLRAAAAAKDPEVVASWKGGQLTLGEFAAALDLDAVARVPADRRERAVDAELRTMVNEKLVRIEAASRGYESLPEIARAVRDRREELMEKRLYAEHVFRDVTVTDADVKAYYDAHAADFAVPERRHVAHVATRTAEELEVVKAELAAGATFEELAGAPKTDGAAPARMGGDLGWITRKDVPKDMAAIFEARPGVVVGPFEASGVHHLVKVLAIAPERTPPLEEVAAEVRKKAQREKNQEKRDEWVRKLRAEATITINEAGVRKFVEEGAKDLERNPAKPPPAMAPGHGSVPGHGSSPGPSGPHT